jgi:hypothetical protein
MKTQQIRFVTLTDADGKLLWEGAVAFASLATLAGQIMGQAGRENLHLLPLVAEVRLEDKIGQVEWLGDWDIDPMLQTWKIIAANPDQLDWSYPVRRIKW